MYAPDSDSITLLPGPHKGQHIRLYPRTDFFVYQYHFDPPYKHAAHYTGYTGNLLQRLMLHEHGYGANLTGVAVKAGCRLILCRVWRCESATAARALERKLKRDHGPKFCPLCNPRLHTDPNALLAQGHWPFSAFCRPGRRQATGEKTWKLHK